MSVKGWHYKDGLLTWVDTGQTWEVSHWTDKDLSQFLSKDFDSQCGQLENLEEVEV